MTLRSWLVALLVVLAAALAFAAVRPGMGESNPNVRFVREMTQHHLQAIDMATRARDNTQDTILRALALDIMLSQQEQVGQMRGWLTLWNVPWGGAGMSAEHARRMGMAGAADVRLISQLPSAQAEQTFLRLMIRHHEGALLMTQDALQRRLRPEVRALAQQMQNAQGAEIKLMRTLLAQRGAQPLPSLLPPASQDALDALPMDHPHEGDEGARPHDH